MEQVTSLLLLIGKRCRFINPNYAAAKFAKDARRKARRRTFVLQVPDNKADLVKLADLLIFLFVPYCSVFEVHNLGLSTIFLGQQVPETASISCSLKLPSPKCRKEKRSLHFRMKKLRTSDSKLRGKGDG
ncbi:MAG: hypothetical protein JRI48_02815 [Deltaproteobacteria bacterium]|nr:hypothetical protein [Deltaproteobacteria bacterium]